MRIRRVTLNAAGGWTGTAAAFLFCVLAVIEASGQTYHIVEKFDGANGEQGNSITQGFDGSLYGTTANGGANGVGTVFKIDRNGQLSTIYSFCLNCSAGFGSSPLVLGENGHFYGADYEGAGLWGAIYGITPAGNVTTLYEFSGSDGKFPDRSLVLASDGNFYGLTDSGGTADKGTLFEITATGSLTTVYNFCALANCADGAYPVALLEGADGKLYGATSGGEYGYSSTIFRLESPGSLTTLYTFGATSNSTAPSFLIQGTDGNLYGLTTPNSLTCASNPAACGTFFQLTASGTFTTLYNFCSQPNCTDGWLPEYLILANDGNFYGNAESGGISGCYGYGCGTIFKLTPGGTLRTIHTFLDSFGDGQEPTYLTQKTDGSFFGTTYYGGSHGHGIVFQISTGLAPFIKVVQNSGKIGDSRGILGQGFTGTTGVFLNGIPASFSVVSDTLLSATVPAGASSGYITVQTPTGTLKSNVPFRVTP